jgi:hypothetical protein
MWRTFRLQPFPSPDDSGGTGAPPQAAPDGPKPIVFQSQADLDAVIEDRLQRERRKHAGSDAERQELERLRTDQRERERKEAEAKGNYERALASKDEEFQRRESSLKERESTLLKELRRDRVDNSVMAAAADAINPSVVARLLNDRVQLDDELRVVVLDEAGRPEYEGGKPRSVASLVRSFLNENPYLVKPSGTGGAGSQGGASGSDQGGMQDGQSRGALEALLKDLEEAEDKARSTGDPADVTKAAAARRRFDAKKRELASSK